MSDLIPPRQSEVERKERRFYVVADNAVKLELEKEAYQRGTDIWTLGGAVITAWITAGCPPVFNGSAVPCDARQNCSSSLPPLPSPSLSVADHKELAE